MGRSILLTLEYDGTAFCGWQIQPDVRTVQGELDKILQKFLVEPGLKTMGSGRTDSGVHALGMGVSFHTESPIPLEGLVRGLNAQMPPDISVLTAQQVPAGFCARRWSKGKRYRYRYWNALRRPALERDRAWHIRNPMDLEAMRQAASHLLGRHDFSAFRASGCSAKHPTRDIWDVSIFQEGSCVVLEIFGSAFLRHMVRNIAGSLAVVGRGEESPEWFGEVLRQRDRQKAARTAPPQGLYLVHVNYELPPEELINTSDLDTLTPYNLQEKPEED